MFENEMLDPGAQETLPPYVPPAIMNACKPTEIYADYINGAWEGGVKIYMAKRVKHVTRDTPK